MIQTTKKMLQGRYEMTRRQAVKLQRDGTEYESNEALAQKVAQVKELMPHGKTLKKAEKKD